MIIKRNTIPWQTIDEKVVIINPQKNEVVELNSVASTVWQSIDVNGSPVSTLLDAVLKDYEVDSSQAETDINEIIHKLHENQMVLLEE